MRLPSALQRLSWELPHNFLGLDEQGSDFERARVVILPVPYEATTSYGGGTSGGPGAIIESSRYIELYDQELDRDPYEVGICTLPQLELTGAGPEEAISELRRAYDELRASAPDKFIIMLGGEHSVSSAPILHWADAFAASNRVVGKSGKGAPASARNLTVLQFDAHTDLRTEYEGSPYSHAAVMFRVIDRVNLVSVGIRALTREERALSRTRDNIHLFLADDIHSSESWMDDVMAQLTEDVYVSFDVDCFDPSLVPSTGTPEPGGLQWYPVLKLLRRVFRERNVLALDVVELAPVPGLQAPDFLVAKLIYKMIGYKFYP
jgi:N1-aminopropylagmatine ureohydrolase